MPNRRFQGRQLLPLKREDWPVFHDDALILKKFPWETFCGLSDEGQVQAEIAVMGFLWGDPYLRCRTIIHRILYEEYTGEATYGLNLMYKCWKMGAFEPCRRYLEDGQEIFDVESSDEEQYEAHDPEEYDSDEDYNSEEDSASDSDVEEEDWIGKFKRLQLNNVKQVETGQNRLRNTQEVQMQDSDDEADFSEEDYISESDSSTSSNGYYSSSGSSNMPITNSNVIRERSSPMITNAGVAKNTAAITSKGERSFSEQKRSNEVQVMVPKDDMRISNASKGFNNSSQNTRKHERPRLSASGTSASKSSSESHTPQVDKRFHSAPIQYSKTFDSVPRHPVLKYEEREFSVPSQVSNIPSTPASRAQKAHKNSLASSSSSRSLNTSVKESNYDANNREASHRKTSISVTSNHSSVTMKNDRRTKPLSAPVHSAETDSRTNFNLGHSTIKKSTSKDVDKKPCPLALGIDKLESNPTNPVGTHSPKPGNSSRDVPKRKQSSPTLSDHEPDSSESPVVVQTVEAASVISHTHLREAQPLAHTDRHFQHVSNEVSPEHHWQLLSKVEDLSIHLDSLENSEWDTSMDEAQEQLAAIVAETSVHFGSSLNDLSTELSSWNQSSKLSDKQSHKQASAELPSLLSMKKTTKALGHFIRSRAPRRSVGRRVVDIGLKKSSESYFFD